MVYHQGIILLGEPKYVNPTDQLYINLIKFYSDIQYLPVYKDFIVQVLSGWDSRLYQVMITIMNLYVVILSFTYAGFCACANF
jgi:hypothetical protein